MINYEYASLFLQDSIDKQLHIYFDNGVGHLTNSDLYAEEFTLRESICSESQLHFGACESGSVEFKIANSGASLKGKTITVQMVLGGHTEAPFTIGVYKVQSDKPTADRFGRVVTAYDALYDVINADVTSWWNALPASFSIKTLRDSFFNRFGITQKATTLPNDTITITKPTLEKVNGKDVITAICELNGCFGHINRNNQMVYVTLGEIIEGLFPADDLFPKDDLYPREERVGAILTKSIYTHAEYEDYTVHQISGIRIYNSKNELITTYRNTTNVYNIVGNILADGLNVASATTVLQNLFSQIGNIWYMPCSVESRGNPCIETGDSVQLATSDRVIYMFVMERILKGIQALKDTYESHGEEYRVDNMNSLANKIQSVNAKADSAYSYAGTAQNRADEAYTYAGTANTNAGKANTAAKDAQDTANGAITRIQKIESDYIKAKDLEAVDARVTNLSSQIITVGDVTSSQDFANAVDDDINNNAKVIGAMQKGTYIEGGYIKTSYINVDDIKAKIIDANTFKGIGISVSSVNASSGITTPKIEIPYDGAYRGQRIRFQTASGYKWLSVLCHD